MKLQVRISTPGLLLFSSHQLISRGWLKRESRRGVTLSDGGSGQLMTLLVTAFRHRASPLEGGVVVVVVCIFRSSQ